MKSPLKEKEIWNMKKYIGLGFIIVTTLINFIFFE